MNFLTIVYQGLLATQSNNLLFLPRGKPTSKNARRPLWDGTTASSDRAQGRDTPVPSVAEEGGTGQSKQSGENDVVWFLLANGNIFEPTQNRTHCNVIVGGATSVFWLPGVSLANDVSFNRPELGVCSLRKKKSLEKVTHEQSPTLCATFTYYGQLPLHH